MDVIPLCESCHGSLHRAGLTRADVEDIKVLHKRYLFTYRYIGELFNISESMVCRIVRENRHKIPAVRFRPA